MSRLQVHGFAEGAAAVGRPASRLAASSGLIDPHRFSDRAALPTITLTSARTAPLRAETTA